MFWSSRHRPLGGEYAPFVTKMLPKCLVAGAGFKLKNWQSNLDNRNNLWPVF
jgi:hypothetical protein